MVPIRMVLAVKDVEYMDPLLHFIRSSEFNRQFVVTAFQRVEVFRDYIEQSCDRVDVVVAEAEFFDESMVLQCKIPWICLSDRGRDKEFSGLRLTKYQPLHTLLTSVLEFVSKNHEPLNPKDGSPRVIGVYSLVGGSGKTTVALNMAKQIAANGARVFYLNLETVDSGVLFEGRPHIDEGKPGLDRLLYDLKAAGERGERPELPVSSYAYRDQILQADLFRPVSNLNEILELDAAGTLQLIDYISESGSYDTVIVDMDSYLNNRSEAVIQRSDQLVWVLTEDSVAMKKTGVWLHHLKHSRASLHNAMMSKTCYAVNRCSGSSAVSLPIDQGTATIICLPLVPSWNQGNQHGMLHTPLFQQSILKLCREMKIGIF